MYGSDLGMDGKEKFPPRMGIPDEDFSERSVSSSSQAYYDFKQNVTS